MGTEQQDVGEKWMNGCPECGEPGSVLAIMGTEGRHIIAELECPYCGYCETQQDPKVAEREFIDVSLWSSIE